MRPALEAERSSISRIYGITDAESAAQYGYGLPPVEDAARPRQRGVKRSSWYWAAERLGLLERSMVWLFLMGAVWDRRDDP